MENAIGVRRSSQQAGAKDIEAVRQHYDTGWRAYLAVAEKALAEEGPNLGRILARCMAARTDVGRKQRGRFRPSIGGEPLSDRVPHASQMAYYTSVVVETIRSLMPHGTERIIEMGSGWGAIIASLWLTGAPRDAKYYALEFTEGGRELSKLLGLAEPNFRLETREFNYHEPVFEDMEQPAKTVVFSIYSIEQITFIKDELIDHILTIPGFERCIHIEPVGWQINPRSNSARIDRVCKALGLRPLDQASAAARRCWRHGKNRNLIETLRRYKDSGKIVIEKIETDFVSNDPLNPGTLVVWRKA